MQNKPSPPLRSSLLNKRDSPRAKEERRIKTEHPRFCNSVTEARVFYIVYQTDTQEKEERLTGRKEGNWSKRPRRRGNTHRAKYCHEIRFKLKFIQKKIWFIL